MDGRTYPQTEDSLKLMTDNTHLLHEGKYHCMADLLFDWFGFGQTSKSFDSFSTTKSKPVKQEVSRKVIIPITK